MRRTDSEFYFRRLISQQNVSYVQFESELALISPEDRDLYLASYGITDKDCGLNVSNRAYLNSLAHSASPPMKCFTPSYIKALVKAAYASLGLQTYFTSGPTETRAWTIRKGMTAPQVSHSCKL